LILIMMTTDAEEPETDLMCCASCGTAEVDDIQLRKCTACHLVRYCSVKCQRNHWRQHKQKCKERAAELRDELLFKQPESTHEGDCPICLLPLTLGNDLNVELVCCNKKICDGCFNAHQIKEDEEQVENPWLQDSCPLCRHHRPLSDAEVDAFTRRRIEANDPVALREVGNDGSVEEDYVKAFQYWSRAAELGDAEAHHHLGSVMYWEDGEGEGVVEKDEKKKIYHLEEASIRGHPIARRNLGIVDLSNSNEGRRFERAIKHFIIAANLGDEESVDMIKQIHEMGAISIELYAEAVRGYNAAVDATKSPEREAAEGMWDKMRKK